MKSMKSVKAFLFCVAAVLTALFAIAVSKPHNTIEAGTDFNVSKNYESHTDLTEDTAVIFDSTDLSENEQTESEENTTVRSDSESEPSVTSSAKEDTVSSQTKQNAVQNEEKSTAKPTTTVSRKTEKTTASQVQKETTTRKPAQPVKTPSDDPEQMTVYYTKTGKRYHYENPCGKGTYYPTTLADAMKRGLTPCQKCVLH